MEEKDTSEITATEIVKGAGINRDTFYAHYRNVQDALSSEQMAYVDEASSSSLESIAKAPKKATGEILAFLNDDAGKAKYLLSLGCLADSLLKRALSDSHAAHSQRALRFASSGAAALIVDAVREERREGVPCDVESFILRALATEELEAPAPKKRGAKVREG